MDNDYPPDWDSRRQIVYKRDNYQCRNCERQGGPHGSAELHAHHIVPKAKGGNHDLSNLTTLCKECHKKTDSYPVEKHTGKPHTWPGPEWNSAKGLSNEETTPNNNNISGTGRSNASNSNNSQSEEKKQRSITHGQVDQLTRDIPSEHFNNYSANYSVQDLDENKQTKNSPKGDEPAQSWLNEYGRNQSSPNSDRRNWSIMESDAQLSFREVLFIVLFIILLLLIFSYIFS